MTSAQGTSAGLTCGTVPIPAADPSVRAEVSRDTAGRGGRPQDEPGGPPPAGGAAGHPSPPAPFPGTPAADNGAAQPWDVSQDGGAPGHGTVSA